MCLIVFLLFGIISVSKIAEFAHKYSESEAVKMEKTYVAIDLKSFYASVECRERGLDPLTTNLVVADRSRTEKTICLAVSPSMKAHGIGGRARLFEVVAKVKEANAKRAANAPYRRLTGKSYNATELANNPSLAIDYIAAPPRMALYTEYSAKIYGIYLRFAAPEDIHVYSVDEVFIDATHYLKVRKQTAEEFVTEIALAVYRETGITATAGIGTNLFLCKVAMDILAKHQEPNKDGVRIAILDEMNYRRLLWEHRPLTDFWRVGRGYAAKLEEHGIYTMGDVARASLDTSYLGGEELLYKLFGVNAELLIDHAWGIEPCTMQDIKAYKPSAASLGSGQVLHCAYEYEKARLILREMMDSLSLDLVDKKLVTDQITITAGYDIECANGYNGEITSDYYGRKVPKGAHGSITLDEPTSSTRLLTDAALSLFDRIVNRSLLVRRINISLGRLIDEDVKKVTRGKQIDVFSLLDGKNEKNEQEEKKLKRERKLQDAMLNIKKKHGKNAVIKGMNLEEGATGLERNNQIGGHKA